MQLCAQNGFIHIISELVTFTWLLLSSVMPQIPIVFSLGLRRWSLIVIMCKQSLKSSFCIIYVSVY